jgi:hypothetical protein
MKADKDNMFASKSKYNLSFKILLIIGDRFEEAFRKYAQGDLDGFYFNLETIKMMLIAFITPQTEKGFDDLEKKIAELRFKEKRFPGKYRGQIAIAMKQYNKALQVIIKDVGVGLPTKQSTYLLFGQSEKPEMRDLEEDFDGS